MREKMRSKSFNPSLSPTSMPIQNALLFRIKLTRQMYDYYSMIPVLLRPQVPEFLPREAEVDLLWELDPLGADWVGHWPARWRCDKVVPGGGGRPTRGRYFQVESGWSRWGLDCTHSSRLVDHVDLVRLRFILKGRKPKWFCAILLIWRGGLLEFLGKK